MARLTWRDVAAPDFTPAMRGLETFSGLLDRGFAGLDQGVSRFDNAQSDRVNQAFQLELAKIQESDNAKERIASIIGSQGNNAGRINAASLAAARALPMDLLRQDAASQALDDTRYASNRGRETDTLNDNAAALLPQAYADIASRDPARVARGEQTLAGLKLRLGEAREVSKDGQDVAAQALQNATGEFNLGASRYRFGNEQQDRADMEAGQAAYVAALGMSGNAEDARAVLTTHPSFRNLSPGALDHAINRLNGVYGSLFGSADVAAGTGGGGGSAKGAGADTVLGYGAFAQPPVPISQMTMGEAHDWADKTLRPASGALNSSATGAFQITAQTYRDFAPGVLGDNWRSLPNSLENQEKVAKAIWEKRKNIKDYDMSETWAGLSPAEATRVKNAKSFDEIKGLIMEAEGTMPSGGLASLNQASLQGQTQIGQINSGTDAEALLKAKNDQRDPIIVARELAKTMEGVPVGFLTSQISSIVQRSRPTLANGRKGNPTLSTGEAAEILLSNYNQQHLGSAAQFFNWARGERTTPNLGREGLRLNDAGINEAIERARTGGNVAAQGSLIDTQEAMASLETARAIYDQAVAQLNSQKQRAETQPGVEAQLPRYQRRVNEAEAQLRKAQDNYQKVSNLDFEAPRERGRVNGNTFSGSLENTASYLLENLFGVKKRPQR